jgi:transposase
LKPSQPIAFAFVRCCGGKSRSSGPGEWSLSRHHVGRAEYRAKGALKNNLPELTLTVNGFSVMFPAMPDAQVIEWIREKYSAIFADLDERARRRWAAAEARSLGWGGIEAVAAATGMSDRTIRTGIRELDDPGLPPPTQQRRSGGGRKRREFEQPKLVEAIQKLVDAGTRGDPMSPLRWTCKSTRTLADELSRVGFSVSANTVGRLLHECGYSLQADQRQLPFPLTTITNPHRPPPDDN